MSDEGRSMMDRVVLHRSLDMLHIQYSDGHREEFTDRERIRWILLENHSIVSLFTIKILYLSRLFFISFPFQIYAL